MRITKCILAEPDEHGNRKDIGEHHPIVDAGFESVGTVFSSEGHVRAHARGTDGSLHTVKLSLAECDVIAAQVAWTRERMADRQ